jgi:hypothetical protein
MVCADRRLADHGTNPRFLRRSGQEFAEAVEKLMLSGPAFAVAADYRAPRLEGNCGWSCGQAIRLRFSSHMKGIGIIAVMALLNAGLSKAGDYTATNNMPEQIHKLMDSEGYAFDQKHFSIPKQNKNSLRNVQFIKRQRFIPFVLAKKAGWSLWNNSNFKYVGRDTDQINLFAPYSALPQIEYDITYSFDF